MWKSCTLFMACGHACIRCNVYSCHPSGHGMCGHHVFTPVAHPGVLLLAEPKGLSNTGLEGEGGGREISDMGEGVIGEAGGGGDERREMKRDALQGHR